MDWPIQRVRMDEVQPDDDWDFRISYPGVAEEERAVLVGLWTLPVVREVRDRRTGAKRFEIVAGQTTFLALKNLGRLEFDARVLGAEVSRLDRRLLNFDHNLRDPHLTSYERAQGIFLLSQDLTPNEIGELFPQLSADVITLSIRARLELPMSITDAWRENRIKWGRIDRLMHIAADRRLEHWMNQGPDSSPPPNDAPSESVEYEHDPDAPREPAKMPEVVGRLHSYVERALQQPNDGPFGAARLRHWLELLEFLLRLRPWPEQFPDPRPRNGRPAAKRPR